MSEARAWGWVASLRTGGTTPWAAWSAEADRTGRFLPGAQQLELLRLVNVATATTGGPDPVLVERILTASAPGRGRPDLELVGAVPRLAYGPDPVDPADLDADELLRVATSLLAEDLVAAGPLPPRPRPRWNRRGRAFRIAGAPWPADAIREELAQRGRVTGGRAPVVHVLGSDPATMTEQAFVARAFAEGGPSWADWSTASARGPRPAPRADLVELARRWRERAGRDRVRVVLDLDQLPRLLGTRGALPAPAVPSADATDLARRTSEPLGLLVLPDEQADLLRRRLLPLVVDDPGPPLRLDADGLAWAHETADRVRRAIERAGYGVVGSTDLLVPHREPGDDGTDAIAGTGPDDTRVLDLAVRLLVEGTVEATEERR